MQPISSVVPVELENGAIIRVQATNIETTPYESLPEVGEEVELDVSLNLRPLKEVADSIEGIAQTIKSALDKVKPSKASVEFSVEFGVEAGQLTAMIVQGSNNANLKVCLEWEKPKPDKG